MLGGSSPLGSSGGAADNNSGDDDRAGERSFGGNRWPRQETLALLKIRSDMDVAFREATVKGPLWDDVSRKLEELGYHRSAKKCKEKFENVYKYHKRTKQGKPDGKTYRFFQQLEALETHQQLQSHKSQASTTASFMNISHSHPQVVTIPSTTNAMAIQPQIQTATSPFQNATVDLLSNSSASTYSDEDNEGQRKKKRKWKDFFERLMNDVINKQEELQKKFIEAIERREHERIAREEAWRMQEMVRINREREILAQERSMAAAKDSAVMSFLQKVSQQQNQGSAQNDNITVLPPPPPPAPPQPSVNLTDPAVSSSRWPKVEIEALIQLRTNLDSKYEDSGPKGPLWEEVSAGMRRLGYNRNSKRCKEKWENINKYFKKVKESNKKRPQDSKTCPYFHQLDALYRNKQTSSLSKQDAAAPLMVRPEQQWPPTTTTSVDERVNNNKQDDTDGDEDDEMEEDAFELVATKAVSVTAE